MNRLLTNKWGENTDTDASTGNEDIISEGGLQYWAAVADILDISSSDVADTGAGTGARTLFVEGLDGDYNPVSESVTLNGVTIVNSKFSYLRVNRAYIVSAGSGGVNAGVLTISDGTGTMASIQIGDAQTKKATYTVPASIPQAAVVLLTGQVAEKTGSHILCHFMVREFGQVWRPRYLMSFDTDAPFTLSGGGGLGLVVGSKSDLRIHVYDASADNLHVVGGFSLVY